MLSKPLLVGGPYYQCTMSFLFESHFACASFLHPTQSTNVLYDFAMADNKMKKTKEKKNIRYLYIHVSFGFSPSPPPPLKAHMSRPDRTRTESSSCERQERVHPCWWGHEDRPLHST